MNFDTHSGDISPLKFTGDVALDEGGLAYSSVSYKDQLELGNVVRSTCSWSWDSSAWERWYWM